MVPRPQNSGNASEATRQRSFIHSAASVGKTAMVAALLASSGRLTYALPAQSALVPLNPWIPRSNTTWPMPASEPTSALQARTEVTEGVKPSARQQRLERLEQLLSTPEPIGFRWRPFCSRLASTLTENALRLSMSVGLSRQVAGGGGSAVGFAIGTSIQSAVEAVWKEGRAAWSEPESSEQDRLFQVLRTVRAETAAEVTALPSAVSQRVHALDTEIKSLVELKKYDKAKSLLRRRQGLLLSIPQRSKNLSQRDVSGDAAAASKIDSAVERLLAEYPPDSRASLQDLIYQIRTNSVLDVGSRVQVYLQGDPGTGKTRFVKALARILGAPLYQVSLKDAAAYTKLAGPAQAFFHGLTAEESEEELVGVLPFALMQTGVTNPIIFIDEADDVLGGAGGPMAYDPASYELRQALSSLKKLLDTDARRLALPVLGHLDIDFSHATLVFAGNARLTDPALKTRLEEITFPALPRDIKVAIATRALDAELKKYLKHYPSSQQHIRQTVTPWLARVVDEDIDRGNAGARVLKNCVRRLVSFVQQRAANSGTCEASDLERVIHKTFEQFALAQ